MTPTSPPDTERSAQVRELATGLKSEPGALMPILHAVMERVGWISREDMADIADVLNLSVADVHGVVSFYHDFRTSPPPAHSIQVCRGEACQTMGAEKLFDDAKTQHEAHDDVDVREVFCVGNCALGPSGMVDGALHGRLTSEKMDTLTEGWRK